MQQTQSSQQNLSSSPSESSETATKSDNSSFHTQQPSTSSSSTSFEQKPQECCTESDKMGVVNQELIDTLNDLILNESKHQSQAQVCNFPVILKLYNISNKEDLVEKFNNEEIDISLQNTEFSDSFIVNFQSKQQLDKIVYELYSEGIDFQLDYSKFISHPGVLFIKNLSSNLVSKDSDTNCEVVSINLENNNVNHDLYEFLMKNCHFKSLTEVKIFNNDSGNNITTSTSFAIVKFDNYLDVEILIDKFNKYVPNLFNNNQNIPLFLNKYLNKRERFQTPSQATSSQDTQPSNNQLVKNGPSCDNFNTIVVENLLHFLPGHITIEEFETFISKFKQFGNSIECIYFPILEHQEDSNEIECFDFGYIKFDINENLMENTLRILYHLNELCWDEFVSFDCDHLPSLIKEKEVLKDSSELNNEVSITIAQHKHNHYLYSCFNNYHLCLSTNAPFKIEIVYPNPIFIMDSFFKNLNYQETNIYVNSLPVIFNNDDSTWEHFWKQFGVIKSAKIIKPQFYHENEDENKSGKIGFIFYQSFKMAIKAILMTNNKVVNINDSCNKKLLAPIVIQSSFAIQKLNNNGANNNVTGKTLAKTNNHQNAAKTINPGPNSSSSSSFFQPMMPYFYGFPPPPPNPFLFGPPPQLAPPPLTPTTSSSAPTIQHNPFPHYLMTTKQYPYCYFEQEEIERG